MFWRKNWHWLLVLIVVIGVGGFILLKPKPPTAEKKVYNVPDFSQVRKDASSKGDKTPTEQTVAENTETTVGKPLDPANETSETPLESSEKGVPLEHIEDVAKLAADPNDWRIASYGESDYGFGAYPQIPSDILMRIGRFGLSILTERVIMIPFGQGSCLIASVLNYGNKGKLMLNLV